MYNIWVLFAIILVNFLLEEQFQNANPIFLPQNVHDWEEKFPKFLEDEFLFDKICLRILFLSREPLQVYIYIYIYVCVWVCVCLVGQQSFN